MKFLLVRILLFVCIAGISLVVPGMASAEAGQTAANSDYRHLEGRWIRPDGGYVLELKDIQKDGSLKASYFNPRSIKVHQAKWSREKGMLNLFVELRDVNYPGSTYTVQYDPKSGRLKGTYFQAMEKQTYTIEFLRVQ